MNNLLRVFPLVVFVATVVVGIAALVTWVSGALGPTIGIGVATLLIATGMAALYAMHGEDTGHGET